MQDTYKAYDLVVIGGGPAGVTAALRGRELGARTALVERGLLGGTCTNDGCVPTRVLAKAARLFRDTELFELYGLDAQRPTVDFRRLLERAQQVVYQVQEKKQLMDHLQSVGVDVFAETGNASFGSRHQLDTANGGRVIGQRFVICAGGRARRLPVPGGELALTHSDIWSIQSLPESVNIIGAGATGVQLATIFNTFGAKVRIIDFAPRLLPTEDLEVSRAIQAAFEANGIEVVTGTKILALEKRDDGQIDLVTETDGQQHKIQGEAVLAAVGWPGNTDTLNLAAVGIETNGPYVKVDEYLRTSAENIYAAGDITGKIMLVQTASQQARIAVENALGQSPTAYVEQLVPHGGFTDPEYGAVGLTEAQAREQLGADNVVVATVPMADIDRAVIDGRTEGFGKLIARRDTGALLGAHFVGEQAIELTNVVAAGLIDGLKVDRLAELEFAYPSFCAVIAAAARQIARELQSVTVVAQWRELSRKRMAEWERRA
ncbi:MAG: NAD(P)/FAD-dependent oxidoreductase [Pleurocapsa minor GSE-CHR-MK-17-07R]|jgi:pyruvate/2-oxoglutarate dehydrogenase complex dihydrolipoamide dehydrogenase (E3) component|nr:NAD(P)/FAD-dependent oxidoreductase [Pleurocapsa minor GSE-CHR-MK 17-07R]